MLIQPQLPLIIWIIGEKDCLMKMKISITVKSKNEDGVKKLEEIKALIDNGTFQRELEDSRLSVKTSYILMKDKE